jgi:signal transduction histidine kinase
MFHEHQDDLYHFLTVDQRGRQIPSYLNLVAESLSGNHQTIQDELDALMKQVDHLKQVITSPKDVARVGNILEPALADELMEQALLMAMPELEQYGIEVTREYRPVPRIMTDRHQVLQILVNVITNARNAMVEYPGRAHRLRLRVGMIQDGGRSVRFEVADTGCGIAAENLPRLFAQGFTTRKTGRGLGLHSAAISAKSLGGSIRAHSEGEGRGAIFTLDLPPTLAEVAA